MEIKELISRLGSMIAFEIKINDEIPLSAPYSARLEKLTDFLWAPALPDKKSYALDCKIDVTGKGTIGMGPGASDECVPGRS